MIGVSGSGKSTYIKNNLEGYCVCSTDSYIEEFGTTHGYDYNESYKHIQEYNLFGDATAKFYDDIENNIIFDNDFVIDRTNLSEKGRRMLIEKLRLLSKQYEKIIDIEYIVFKVNIVELKSRLDKRSKEENKRIPTDVIDNQIKSFNEIQSDEGYNEITIINHNDEVKS